MPVVAVGFALALDVGAIGALAAGTLTTLAAITAIGATVSAIGAVTHDKTLSMIGMGIGIVGALGTLASGAGLFDNATELFGSGQMSAADSASLASDASSMGDEALTGLTAANAAGEAGASANLSSAMGVINQTAVNPVAAQSAALAPAEGSAAATVAAPGSALEGSLSSSAADAAAKAADPINSSLMKPYMSAHLMPEMDSIGSSVTGDIASSASGLMEWANKNPMMAFGAIQAGGSFISGLTNPMTPAQIDALNSQSEVNRATAEVLKRQMANQAAPLPTATVATPAITGRVEQPGGLINNTAPVGTALITGAPNTGTAATKPMGTV